MDNNKKDPIDEARASRLYQVASQVIEGIPDYNSFRTALADPAMRQRIHGVIKDSNIIEGFPDYDAFNESLITQSTQEVSRRTREQTGALIDKTVGKIPQGVAAPPSSGLSQTISRSLAQQTRDPFAGAPVPDIRPAAIKKAEEVAATIPTDVSQQRITPTPEAAELSKTLGVPEELQKYTVDFLSDPYKFNAANSKATIQPLGQGVAWDERDVAEITGNAIAERGKLLNWQINKVATRIPDEFKDVAQQAAALIMQGESPEQFIGQIPVSIQKDVNDLAYLYSEYNGVVKDISSYLEYFPNEAQRLRSIQETRDRNAARLPASIRPEHQALRQVGRGLLAAKDAGMQLLGSLYGAAKNVTALVTPFVSQEGVEQALGYVGIEALANGIGNAYDDYLRSYVDTQIFDKGEFKEENIVPAIAETATMLAAIIYSGGAASATLRGTGMSAARASQLGTFASGYMFSVDDFYKDAEAKGLIGEDKFYYASGSAFVAGLVEALAPSSFLTGKLARPTFDKALDLIQKGDLKARDVASYIIKQLPEELGEETAAILTQTGGNIVANAAFGTDFDDEITKDEFLSNVFLTTAGISLLGAIRGKQGIIEEQQEYANYLRDNKAEFEKWTIDAVTNNRITREEALQLAAYIDNMTSPKARAEAVLDATDPVAKQAEELLGMEKATYEGKSLTITERREAEDGTVQVRGTYDDGTTQDWINAEDVETEEFSSMARDLEALLPDETPESAVTTQPAPVQPAQTEVSITPEQDAALLPFNDGDIAEISRTRKIKGNTFSFKSPTTGEDVSIELTDDEKNRIIKASTFVDTRPIIKEIFDRKRQEITNTQPQIPLVTEAQPETVVPTEPTTPTVNETNLSSPDPITKANAVFEAKQANPDANQQKAIDKAERELKRNKVTTQEKTNVIAKDEDVTTTDATEQTELTEEQYELLKNADKTKDVVIITGTTRPMVLQNGQVQQTGQYEGIRIPADKAEAILAANAEKQKVRRPSNKAELTETLKTVFKLPSDQADAAADIIDRMVATMAVRAKKTKQEIYASLRFQRGVDRKVPANAKAAMLKRGALRIIAALQDPDVSSPLHELAHVFEDFLSPDEQATVIKYAKSRGQKGDAWTRETSEAFAEGFERYLRDGIAPSTGIQKIFDQFKDWIRTIASGTTVLNPQMREIYDLMLEEGQISRAAQITKPEKGSLAKGHKPIKSNKAEVGDIVTYKGENWFVTAVEGDTYRLRSEDLRETISTKKFDEKLDILFESFKDGDTVFFEGNEVIVRVTDKEFLIDGKQFGRAVTFKYPRNNSNEKMFAAAKQQAFIQRQANEALQNIATTATTPQENPIVKEIKGLPLTRVEGLAMGANQAVGVYVSTEAGNRYADFEGAGEIIEMEVDITNPYVLEDGILELHNLLLNQFRDKFDQLDFDGAQFPTTERISVEDISYRGKKKLAQLTTDYLIDKGYDSVYFRQSDYQEGELVVFDRAKIRKKESLGSSSYKANRETHLRGNRVNGRQIGNMTFSGVYKIIPAEQAMASHNEQTFSETIGFPKVDQETANNRDYKRDTQAQGNVISNAQQFGPKAVEAAPIVTKDGVVIDGNGRTMSRKRAAKNKTDRAYLKFLRENSHMYGFSPQDIDNVQNPMLVFEIDEDVPYTTETFANFNVEDKKAQNDVMKASDLSKRLSTRAKQTIADIFEGSEAMKDVFDSKEKVKAIRRFLLDNNIVSSAELPRYFKGDGLTTSGKELITATLLGTTLDPDAIFALSQEGMGNTRQAIILNMSQMVSNAMKGKDSLVENFNKAIKTLNVIRAAGISIEDYVSQMTMFDTTGMESVDWAVLGMIRGDRANNKTLKAFLKNYNETAGVPSLLGTVSKEQVIDEFLKQNINDYEQARERTASNDKAATKGVQKRNGRSRKTNVDEEYFQTGPVLNTAIRDFADKWIRANGSLSPAKFKRILPAKVQKAITDEDLRALFESTPAYLALQERRKIQQQARGEASFGTEQRKSAERLIDKTDIDQSTKDKIKARGLRYFSESVNQSEQQVLQWIETVGLDEATNMFLAESGRSDSFLDTMSGNDLPGHLQVFLGIELIRQHNQLKNNEKAAEVAIRLAEIGTTLGRGVNAFKGITMLTGEGLTYAFGRLVNNAKEGLKEKYRNRIQQTINKYNDAKAKAARDTASSFLTDKTWIQEGKERVLKALKGETDILFQTGIDTKVKPDIIRFGMFLVLEGNTDFTKWSGKMKTQFGLTDAQTLEIWDSKYDGVNTVKDLGVNPHFANAVVNNIDNPAKLTEFFDSVGVYQGNKLAESINKAYKQRVAKEFAKQANKAERAFVQILASGDELDVTKIQEGYIAAAGFVGLDPELEALIQKTNEILTKSPTYAMKEAAVQRLMNAAFKKMGREPLGKYAMAAMYFNLLSGIPTHLVNLVANVTQVAGDIVGQSFLAPLIDVVTRGSRRLRLLPPVRSNAGEVARATRLGARLGVSNAKDILMSGRLTQVQGQKYELPNLPERFSWAADVMGNLHKMAANAKGGNIPAAFSDLLQALVGGYFTAAKYSARAMDAADALTRTPVMVSYYVVASEHLASREFMDSGPMYQEVVKDLQTRGTIQGDPRSKQNEPIVRKAIADRIRGWASGDIETLWTKLRQEVEDDLRASGLPFTPQDIDNGTMERFAPDYRVKDIAERKANRSVFRQKPEGSIGAIAEALNSLSRKFPPTSLVVPFTNILANVTNTWLDYFPPVAIMRATGISPSAVVNKMFNTNIPDTSIQGSGKFTRDLEEQIIRRNELLYRATVGMIAGVIAALALGGEDEEGYPVLTGAGPKDYKKKKELESRGHAWFSVRVPGIGYVSYQYLPVGATLSFMGNYFDLLRYGTEKEKEGAIASAVMGFPSFMLNATFLAGLSDFFKTLSQSDKFTTAETVASTASRQLSKFVPFNALLNNAEAAMGYDQPELVGWQMTFRAIPFVRGVASDRPSLDHFGRPISKQLKEGILSNVMYHFVGTKRFYKPKIELDATEKLFQEKNYYTPEITGAFTINKVPIESDPILEYDVHKYTQRLFKQQADNLAQNYATLDEEAFEKAMDKIHKNCREAIRQSFMLGMTPAQIEARYGLEDKSDE